MARDAEEGFFLVSSQEFNLIILDLGLPDRSGFEFLETFRGSGNIAPVLILSAMDSVDDKVRGFESGANDYMVKPFALPELHARVKNLLRRNLEGEARRLVYHGLEMDLLKRKVWRDGEEIALTTREFNLLEFLLRHQENVVTRDMIRREVWEIKEPTFDINNILDVHINALRKKVDHGHDPLIHTVRGVGFCLRDQLA
jgi:DNA-binding response OmpR family regulator